MNARLGKPRPGFVRWVKRLGLLVILLSLVSWSAGTLAKSNLMKRYPAPGQLVGVGGYKMHLYCTGKGSPTVILAAGLDDFSAMWSLVQPEVANITRVCSYDRSGLGWSERSRHAATSASMVKELHTLLVNAKVEGPYVLVGHSFGGALVRLYSHEYPDEVAGIVLVDSVHEDLFIRLPFWRKAIEQKLRVFRILAPLSTFGILALAPESIPNRGLPDEALAQYRAISVATQYYWVGITESEAFEKNLAEVRAAHMTSLGNLPLIVLSRGYWDTMPFLSKAENQQAWEAWQEMQSELAALSSESKQSIARQSEHFIQLQQPELVTEAIREMVDATRN